MMKSKHIVRMKTVFCSFGLLMAAVPAFAQNTGKDSIVSTKALDDVVVSASNILSSAVRQPAHILHIGIVW